jgi:hypothetical protein
VPKVAPLLEYIPLHSEGMEDFGLDMTMSSTMGIASISLQYTELGAGRIDRVHGGQAERAETRIKLINRVSIVIRSSSR